MFSNIKVNTMKYFKSSLNIYILSVLYLKSIDNVIIWIKD